jgi:hypothetical protein
MTLLEVRRGVTRTVFLTKRYAIKVPRQKACKGHKAWTFIRGWSANMSEVDWSKYATTAYGKPQVAPVLKSYLWGLVNIYPRAKAYMGSWEELDDLYDTLEFKTPSDVKGFNFGWLDGNFVWLDYDMNWNDCRKEHNE